MIFFSTLLLRPLLLHSFPLTSSGFSDEITSMRRILAGQLRIRVNSSSLRSGVIVLSFSISFPVAGRECGIRGSLLSASRLFSGRHIIKFFRVTRSFDRSLKRRN